MGQPTSNIYIDITNKRRYLDKYRDIKENEAAYGISICSFESQLQFHVIVRRFEQPFKQNSNFYFDVQWTWNWFNYYGFRSIHNQNFYTLLKFSFNLALNTGFSGMANRKQQNQNTANLKPFYFLGTGKLSKRNLHRKTTNTRSYISRGKVLKAFRKRKTFCIFLSNDWQTVSRILPRKAALKLLSSWKVRFSKSSPAKHLLSKARRVLSRDVL